MTPPDCVCGARYRDYRTGLNFAEVRELMKTHDPDCYRQLRRHSVLGFWHELKRGLWSIAHGGCD